MKEKKPTLKQQALIENALSLQQSGEWTKSAVEFKKLVKLFPQHPQLLSGLGITELKQNHYEQAISLFNRALKIAPQQPNALSNRGIALFYVKRLHEALASFDQALALNPNHVMAHYNRGLVFEALGQLDDALNSIEKAIAIHPNYPDALSHRGVVLKQLKFFDAAIESLERAIDLQPNNAKTHFQLGALLYELKQYVKASEVFQRCLELDPDFLDAHIAYVDTLSELNQHETATHYDVKTIAQQLDFAMAYSNWGTVLYKQKRYAQASVHFKKTLALNPNLFETHLNLGNCYMGMLDVENANVSFDTAIAMKPGYWEANYNKAHAKLLAGKFDEGWPLYEWRWENPAYKSSKRNYPQPLWLGNESIAGKLLLIYPEQGLGDFIQFCRYALALKALGASVTLETPPSLLPVIKTLDPEIRYVESGQALPNFDYYCPIMSLPLAFKTTLANIPATTPYLYADQQKVADWQTMLGNKNRLRVGLVWSGNKNHSRDSDRSLTLALLQPLLSLPVEFHTLQKEIRREDAETLAAFPQLKQHEQRLVDFSDTAALITCLDLVISVDTSVAHLAAALGKPVWILLTYLPDFRWLLGRSDSPWYPTAKLFRQTEIGNWSSVIDEVIQELSNQRFSKCLD
jgi:tetratricopeptide (TPR) repeat protein